MAHEGLWELLNKFDPTKTAQRAKCQYLSSPERYIVTLLNAEYVVNLSDRNIFSVQSGSPQSAVLGTPYGGHRRKASPSGLTVEPAEFLEQLCILAYLINARDLPLADKLIGAETLPGGQFFFRGLHSLPTEKLKNVFGNCPEVLHRVSAQFDAERCEFGDASIRLYVLPRLPLTIVIWRHCEEFDARASILFDQTAASQLPLDALLAAVNLTVGALVSR
ncbi:MAG: DUF3786 domain-containing protein [Planctomycetes bacterium]|nr:DUF3786 domain-containing protein [Planctomycetota bacterium]MCH8118661.1 DUF3786 domain-containing protein [Planctomycetota bacterium]